MIAPGVKEGWCQVAELAREKRMLLDRPPDSRRGGRTSCARIDQRMKGTSVRVQSGRDDPSDRSSILGTPLWMGQDDLAVGAKHHVSAQLATVLAEV